MSAVSRSSAGKSTFGARLNWGSSSGAPLPSLHWIGETETSCPAATAVAKIKIAGEKRRERRWGFSEFMVTSYRAPGGRSTRATAEDNQVIDAPGFELAPVSVLQRLQPRLLRLGQFFAQFQRAEFRPKI